MLIPLDAPSKLGRLNDEDALATARERFGDEFCYIGNAKPDAALASACAGADLVLSLVSLDPARGGDHLGTWATNVVAMVTAGRSTATRIHTVGEMIRLSGARLASVVVLDFDKADESLGASTETVSS